MDDPKNKDTAPFLQSQLSKKVVTKELDYANTIKDICWEYSMISSSLKVDPGVELV